MMRLRTIGQVIRVLSGCSICMCFILVCQVWNLWLLLYIPFCQCSMENIDELLASFNKFTSVQRQSQCKLATKFEQLQKNVTARQEETTQLVVKKL